MKKFFSLFLVLALMGIPNMGFAGAFDASKGLDKISLDVELVCLGCSIKKISGANAQCGLYTHHDVGIQFGDGTLWSIVNNAKGHDIIRAHGLVIGKKAKVGGWLYPAANHVEIDSIAVEGVSSEEIAKAAWKEDQEVGKALMGREVGKPPVYEAPSGHKH